MYTNLHQNKKTVLVRIPKKLHQNLKMIAAIEETSMIKLLTTILEAYFNAEVEKSDDG